MGATPRCCLEVQCTCTTSNPSGVTPSLWSYFADCRPCGWAIATSTWTLSGPACASLQAPINLVQKRPSGKVAASKTAVLLMSCLLPPTSGDLAFQLSWQQASGGPA